MNGGRGYWLSYDLRQRHREASSVTVKIRLPGVKYQKVFFK